MTDAAEEELHAIANGEVPEPHSCGAKLAAKKLAGMKSRPERRRRMGRFMPGLTGEKGTASCSRWWMVVVVVRMGREWSLGACGPGLCA